MIQKILQNRSIFWNHPGILFLLVEENLDYMIQYKGILSKSRGEQCSILKQN